MMNEIYKSIPELERQMGQIAVSQTIRSQGALPRNTEKNLKEQLHVGYLRNGRQLEEVPLKNKKVNAELIPTKRIETEQKNAKNVAEQPEVVACRPPSPFPQRLQKQKVDSACKIFLKILKQVNINIPLVNTCKRSWNMLSPEYAKYIKYVVANKICLTEFEIVALIEECSSRVRSKIPPKLKDPGSFTISITIGNVDVRRPLCDLSATINFDAYFCVENVRFG
ncbi:uncharacterized protein LOC132601382 [Lycium barbarum]|uniref:uncharacterized protein LOC132601382 n=1 Tax=Lycium barbarum TaxID=112863 RepID=UPI00293EBDF9|nr:uncharacterized protein LOC132601382 [Lycium barbarum]